VLRLGELLAVDRSVQARGEVAVTPSRVRNRLAVARFKPEPGGDALALGAVLVAPVAAAGAQPASEAPRDIAFAP
jgi:hypothetical protein